MTTFPRETILALCQKYGLLLRVPYGLDGPRIMAAIASNESTLGADCGPRHEPAYDVGGLYAGNPKQAALLKTYGRAAACSYGAWQVMLVNAGGFTPDELNTDPETGARAFLGYFNDYVIGVHNAKILEQIGEVYNGGHIYTDPIPASIQAYVSKLCTAYGAIQFSEVPCTS